MRLHSSDNIIAIGSRRSEHGDGIHAGVKPMFRTVAGISLVLCFSGIFLAFRVIRPIRKLKTQAKTMAKQIADEHVEDVNGNEVANLVQVFNCMADVIKLPVAGRQALEAQLKEHRTHLENQVLERTAHLNHMNEQLRHEINGRILTEAKLLENKGRLEKTLDDLKRTQAAMIQSEKLASVGQLAAGVAHEINNPIGFVKSNLHTLTQYQEDISELLKQYREFATRTKSIVGPDDDSHVNSKDIANLVLLEAELDIAFIMEDIPRLIHESNEGIERIQKIVSALINFAHPGEKDIQLTDINECLESTLKMLWNDHNYKVRFTKNYGWIPPVSCYPQKINQVFTNILANAVQAIENTGEIIISTVADEKWVTICIADSGPGIAPAHLPRIFDPFFTTKEIGKGTGLGLHIARDIVQLHGGSIHVESTFGKGTTFKIRLPHLSSENPTC
jgi:two-component system NtrC family sensor kinase